MTTVLLEGPGAGMTTEEYETMRALDCACAEGMGWKPFDTAKQLWHAPFESAFKSVRDDVVNDGAFRDEPNGVPFFSNDMNGAWLVLDYALKTWRHSARQIFFGRLQARASFESKGVVQWPDVLTSLVTDLPEHICTAFVETLEFAKVNNFDLVSSGLTVEIESREWTDSDGNKRTVPGIKPGSASPWVKVAPIQPGRDTLD